MTILKKLLTLSEQLLTHVGNDLPNNPEARDEFIDKIETFLSERQKLVNQLEGAILSEEEKEMGKKIVSLNQAIDERLKVLQMQIRRDINVFRDKKVKNRKYESPYDGPTLEGVFIDKRGI